MPADPDIIYPVIFNTPPEQQAISGRGRVLFLRQYARRAVALSAERKGLSLPALLNDPDGKPIPESGVFWSLSHKPEIVAGVAGRQPVGIDIETLRPVRPGLMERISDAEERRLAEQPVTDLTFFRFWTAKEAVLKAVGIGLRGLSFCKIHHIIDGKALIVSCHQNLWRVAHTFNDHYVASAACPDHRVEWRWIVPESGQ